uniref:Uncharacterized protein n=1 Tax=viral metagenome TaxID=1070528 RepID=A0A6M3LVJ9_9ZZZZ
MILTLKMDTDELYGEDGIDFESLLTTSLKTEIIRESKKNLASEKFADFAKLASDTIIADIKLRMENFLSEEISLTEGWGKPTFVGSIEDLIKKRFDDVLLRPVDSSGQTIQGCTSSGRTWVEWAIEKRLEETKNNLLKEYQSKIINETSKAIKEKIIQMKDMAIKEQVDSAFASILTKTSA